MRVTVLALISACALAACNPSAPNGADSGGGLFPDLNGGSYRQEITVTSDEAGGAPVAMVMIRDGAKVRWEINSGEGLSTIINNGEHTYIITNEDGRTMAIEANGVTEAFTNPADQWRGELSANATRSGSCSVAGQNGEEWTKTSAEDGTQTVCVTNDGILLRATDEGRTVWETTRVDRGAQAAAQFELPEGVQVMNLGDIGGMMEGLTEAARDRQN